MSASTVPLHAAAAPFLHEPVTCPAASVTPLLRLRPSPLLLRADSFILARWVILPGPLVVEGPTNQKPTLQACARACFDQQKCTSACLAQRSSRVHGVLAWRGTAQHTGA